VNRQRNLTFARNMALNRDRNVRIVNNWRSDRFRGTNYAVFYSYNRVWHDRVWWVNNYSTIVFVLGGWWYWNAGYWYPAWGYDPYGWYAYDGLIYTGYGIARRIGSSKMCKLHCNSKAITPEPLTESSDHKHAGRWWPSKLTTAWRLPPRWISQRCKRLA
jgi:hypothetical protein